MSRRRGRAARAALLVCCTVVSASGAGHAQTVARSAAQSLFEQGRALLESGHVNAACEKFAESKRLDEAVGTVLNLAVCREQQGRTAAAYGEYHRALALAARTGDAERRKLAEERVEKLAPRLCRLEVRPARAVRGLKVSVDGTALGDAAFGVPIPIDPGDHVVSQSAPGKISQSISIAAPRPGDILSVELPALIDLPPRPERPVVQQRRDADTLRWLGVGTAFGIAVSAAAVGGYFGIDALGAWKERNEHCGALGCEPEARQHGDRARRAAVLSTVGFSVALSAAAAGTVLYISGARSSFEGPAGAARPKHSRSQIRSESSSLQLVARGAF